MSRRALAVRLGAALLALLWLAPVAALAADPIKITADNFTVDDSRHVATFTGSVVIQRTNLDVWAPKVVVDYGDGGPSNIESFAASGGVRIKTDTQEATGDRADYDPVAGKLRLSGNVMVVNASGTVAGPDLVIDLVGNTSTFTGGKGGRVTGVFTPK